MNAHTLRADQSQGKLRDESIKTSKAEDMKKRSYDHRKLQIGMSCELLLMSFSHFNQQTKPFLKCENGFIVGKEKTLENHIRKLSIVKMASA